MLALYPGARVPAAMIDAHAVGDDAGGRVLAVHLTRYPLDPPDQRYQRPDSLLWLHLAAVVPEPWQTISERIPANYNREHRARLRDQWIQQDRLVSFADVVVTHAREQPPLLVLDAAMSKGAPSAVGVVIDERTCLVGLRTREEARVQETRGYAVVMTADGPQPGPVALYASALLGWKQWWLDRADELSDRPVSLDRLPPPPLELDVVEAWTPHRVHLEAPEHARWPARPLRPRRIGLDWLDEPGLL